MGEGNVIDQHVVLVEPEIPQNTGNVARTCAVTGCTLHLVEPLGFSIDEKHLKRAGLDYWDQLSYRVHKDFTSVERELEGYPFFLITTKGGKNYTEVNYQNSHVLIFGKETAGLPSWIMKKYKKSQVRIPMKEGLRSLNLGTAVAVVTYEALRQNTFEGLL